MQATSILRHRPVFDLKWSLLKQVAAVALLCFLGGAALSVHQAEEETLKANRAVGDAIGRFLEMPMRFHFSKRVDLQTRFREMDPFLDQVCARSSMKPGRMRSPAVWVSRVRRARHRHCFRLSISGRSAVG